MGTGNAGPPFETIDSAEDGEVMGGGSNKHQIWLRVGGV
jgi:hypothetical protein